MLISSSRMSVVLWMVVCGCWVVFSGAQGVENETATTVVVGAEKLETFEELEKKMKANVGNVVKLLLPHLMQGSSDTDVSGPCIASVMKVIGGIRQLKEWAMRFIDATGKIPAGILEGTSFSIGDYDECLEIAVGKKDELPRTPEETIFRGQYCLLEIHKHEAINRAIRDFEEGNTNAAIARTKTFLNLFAKYKHLTNSTMKLGICIPSKCSRNDISNIISSDSIRKNIGKITVSYCEQKEEVKTTAEQVILLCLFGFVIGCVLFSTVVDAFLSLVEGSPNTKSESQNYIRLIIKKTSLYNNALAVLQAEKPEHLPCLSGLRVVIVTIVMYSHTYAHLHALHFQKFSKPANFLRFFESFTFAGIGNGSVTLDSMVFIVAITITYERWRHVSKGTEIKLNILQLLLNRYFRLTAGQLLCIGIFLLFPLVGNGPFWSAYVNPMLDNCRQRWYLNVLYVSNFWEPNNLCLYHTWIISLFMQLTLLGVAVIMILKRSMVCALMFVVVVVLSGVIGVAVMTLVHDLPGSLAFFMLDKRTFPIAWNDLFAMPFDHMGPFCIGLLIGYLVAIKKDKLNVSKATSATFWCLSIACSSAVMFGLYEYRHGGRMDMSLSVFYAVMHRNVWCLGFGWLVAACSTQHGGPVERVLKSDIFLPLDRLVVITYIIHIPIMYFHSGIMRERFYMGHFEIMFQALAYITLSFIVAFILHIFFVEPYYTIEEHIAKLFEPKDKLDFQSKTDLKDISIASTVAASSQSNVSGTGLVNLGYAKNLDKL